MLLKSRENADLFRLPERWRRRLRMRLACSLASVSLHTHTHTYTHAHAHTVHRKDTPTTSDGFGNSLPIIGETFTSRRAYRENDSDSWKSKCHQIKEWNLRLEAKQWLKIAREAQVSKMKIKSAFWSRVIFICHEFCHFVIQSKTDTVKTGVL